MCEHDEHEGGDCDGLGCMRGLAWAVPVGLAAWALALWLLLCHGDVQDARPESPGPVQLVEAA